MSRERIWVTASRQEIKIKDMGDEHIINSARLIIRRGFRQDYLKDFYREIVIRGLPFTYRGPTFSEYWIFIDGVPSDYSRINAPQVSAKTERSYKITHRRKSTEVV